MTNPKLPGEAAPPATATPASSVLVPAPGSKCYRSSDLFGAAREVLIEHDSGYYRLRLTQANKLILTK